MFLRNQRQARSLELRIVIAAAAATFALSCTDDSVGPTNAGDDAAKSAGASEEQQGRTLAPRRSRPPNSRSVPSDALSRAWGGEHIGLELDANRGKVELDCAHGTIDEAIIPGADGSFSVRGTFTAEHGGPISDAEVADTRPARYEGLVRGDEMTLKIIVGGQPLPFGYTLRRNEFPQIVKCL